ncbi:MAG TPA: tetratricopeptide repeat protein, partial [Candidatus Sulfotelmatobacter sp.]|nr:tetratricopeptide repeat protein [Candidatus Sulfotelmatobacter sp.]
MESDVAQLPLSDKLWAWYETYQKQIIGGTAIALVVGLIVWFVVWQQNEKATAAGEALSSVAVAQMGTEGTAGAAEDYLKVAAKYPNTDAGIRAQLLAAGSLFAAGKYAEAQTQFQKFTREHRDNQERGAGAAVGQVHE